MNNNELFDLFCTFAAFLVWLHPTLLAIGVTHYLYFFGLENPIEVFCRWFFITIPEPQYDSGYESDD